MTPRGCNGDNEALEKSAAVESTFVASLGVAVAAMPADAAGEGTVVGALTWETGAVYKHVATFYSKTKRRKVHSTCKPIKKLKRRYWKTF